MAEARTQLAIRVKTKDGLTPLHGLHSDATIGDLKAKLAALTGIPAPQLLVLIGFPPRPLNMSEESTLMTSRGIRSGDTIIIKERTEQGDLSNDMASSSQGSCNMEADGHHQHGVLIRKVVPADNSCLFSSVCYAAQGTLEVEHVREMRKKVAAIISADPVTYSEAVLGQSPRQYVHWIATDEAWGGAIELAVLSCYLGLEIVVVDTQHGFTNCFGESQGYDERIMLLYDGIHYDPLYLTLEGPGDNWNQTRFSTSDMEVMTQARELAREAREAQEYTDLRNFSLRCGECGALLRGEAEARQHAKDTNHSGFSEISHRT